MSKRGKGRDKKKPKQRHSPQISKTAKHLGNPDGYQSKFIAWQLHRMDNGGDWVCNMDIIHGISDRLKEYERMKWSEVLQLHSSHPMPVDNICSGAKRRIDEIGLADTPNLYQLEIKGGGGLQRLWGLRHENVFQILWWDPNHTVYPVGRC